MGKVTKTEIFLLVLTLLFAALKKARWVSRFPGGHGAVRELAEFILKSQGRFEEAVMKRFNTEL